jgi:hypothetical protein
MSILRSPELKDAEIKEALLSPVERTVLGTYGIVVYPLGSAVLFLLEGFSKFSKINF